MGELNKYCILNCVYKYNLHSPLPLNTVYETDMKLLSHEIIVATAQKLWINENSESKGNGSAYRSFIVCKLCVGDANVFKTCVCVIKYAYTR